MDEERAPSDVTSSSRPQGTTTMTFGLIASVAESAPKPGFGIPIGKVGPCPAKTIDELTLPLIVTLLRNGVPYAWYNISADPGTIWCHFDVPAGRYLFTRCHFLQGGANLNAHGGAKLT